MKNSRGKLMALMRRNQMNEKEFAEKCGIEEGRMERLLNGRGHLTEMEKQKIADAFETDEKDIFDIDPIPAEAIRHMEKTELDQLVTERLNTVVQMHGIGVAELAERCGIKEKRARKLLKGEAKLSVMELINISNSFQVCLEYLLGRYPYPLPVPQTEAERQAYSIIGQMSEEELIENMGRIREALKKDLP